MTPEVECYAGSSYPEHPRSFMWENVSYTVQEVIQRRREPQGIGFLVRCSHGNTLFDLFYDTKKDQWQIQPKGYVIIEECPRTKPNFQGD